ncbi:MAG: hypothetical protein K0R81_1509 [Microbacterium sp.]|nr:hypothetical protein [Microbacterium sp.]
MRNTVGASRKTRAGWTVAAVAALAVSSSAFIAAPAMAVETNSTATAESAVAPATSQSTTSVSESCVTQLTDQGVGADEADRACTTVETVTTGDAFQVSPEQARSYAGEAQLDASQTDSLVQAAAAGEIRGSSWTHEYNAVFVREIHTGVTWYDGENAWIASYRGQTGSHSCHTEGGWQVGASVNVVECSTPGPGSSADAVERFDLSAVYQGSPIILNVGLHMKYNADGSREAWQVGG